MAKKGRCVEVQGRQIQLRPERYYWSDFFMALPAVLLLILTTYYPIAKLINISFTDWRLTSRTYEYVGFKTGSGCLPPRRPPSICSTRSR